MCENFWTETPVKSYVGVLARVLDCPLGCVLGRGYPIIVVMLLGMWARYGFRLLLTFSLLASGAAMVAGSYFLWQLISANSGAVYVVLAHFIVLAIFGTVGWLVAGPFQKRDLSTRRYVGYDAQPSGRFPADQS
jgi:hypothetical protein